MRIMNIRKRKQVKDSVAVAVYQTHDREDSIGLVEICEKVGDMLGKGYTETIYHEGICCLLREKKITYSKEVILPIEVSLEPSQCVTMCLGNVRADIVLPIERVIIECKAIDGELRDAHLPQILTYMKKLEYNNGYYVNYMQSPKKGMVQIIKVVKLNDSFILTDLKSNKTN